MSQSQYDPLGQLCSEGRPQYDPLGPDAGAAIETGRRRRRGGGGRGGGGGDGGGGSYTHPHRFEKYNYTAPAYCDLCNSVLWGIVRTGYRCQVSIGLKQ